MAAFTGERTFQKRNSGGAKAQQNIGVLPSSRTTLCMHAGSAVPGTRRWGKLETAAAYDGYTRARTNASLGPHYPRPSPKPQGSERHCGFAHGASWRQAAAEAGGGGALRVVRTAGVEVESDLELERMAVGDQALEVREPDRIDHRGAIGLVVPRASTGPAVVHRARSRERSPDPAASWYV